MVVENNFLSSFFVLYVHMHMYHLHKTFRKVIYLYWKNALNKYFPKIMRDDQQVIQPYDRGVLTS